MVSLLDSKFTEIKKFLEKSEIDNDDDGTVELTDAEIVAKEILAGQLKGYLKDETIKNYGIVQLADAIKIKDAILEQLKESQGNEMNPPRDLTDTAEKPMTMDDILAVSFKPIVRPTK